MLLMLTIVLAAFLVISLAYIISLKTNLKRAGQEIWRLSEQEFSMPLLQQTNVKELQQLYASINHLLKLNRDNRLAYESAYQKMTQTIANITHDLKTPLATALGYLEIMVANGWQSDSVVKGRAKSLEVQHLINQFSQLIRIEAGDRRKQVRLVNINELCREALFSILAQLKDNKFEVVANIPEYPIWINSDDDAIRRSLNNLLQNVCVHGEDGHYLELILAERLGEILIKVRDHGKGIQKHDLDAIFERTFMADETRYKSGKGGGLGLAITKALIAQIQGCIYVESQPHICTTFTIVLPKNAK